jgi:N-acetylglucosamine-6-phosphate deacetylase
VIDYILSQGIVISAGHSNATYNQSLAGFTQGIAAVTHLYNAMSPLQHRSPGLVGAAMTDSRVMASIIPDGHHVDFAAIKIAKEVMKERLFVITDAVTETDRGGYQHYLAGDKYEAGGILSGSALTMAKSVQNLVNQIGIDAGEAIRMCSLYPARVMHLDHELGKIEKGFRAKMLLLDQHNEVIQLVEG